MQNDVVGQLVMANRVGDLGSTLEPPGWSLNNLLVNVKHCVGEPEQEMK